ncbi:hypothetical protein SEPCBS119000_003489 [Sporothrix epigloea]|uniref:Amino acid transporter transmembrane domain-containing protein n=1 Tax=Sporothrix epigloea TaxID=1892477 RepID=A0ABP0DR56_9PEZI
MSNTPPDTPAASAQERSTAQTLAEHLPQGYTADFVPHDQQLARDADAEDGGGRDNSGSSKDGGSPSKTQASPDYTAASSAAQTESDHNADDKDTATNQPEEISSLQLQGGDVHRSLFRMAEAPARNQLLRTQPPSLSPAAAQEDSGSQADNQCDQEAKPQLDRRRNQFSHRRAATFYDRYTPGEMGSVSGDGNGDLGSQDGGTDSMQVRDLLAPQGFRRDFVQQQNRQRQLQEREATMQRRRTHLRERRAVEFGAGRMPIARNFVEFLELYGHFADEDLEESDDDDDVVKDGEQEEVEAAAEDAARDANLERGTYAGLRRRPHERQPLLERGATGTVEPALVGNEAAGDSTGKAKAGPLQAFFTLLKAFVGTGIIFLPKAYKNGGIVFSTVTLLLVSLLSMAGFELLLRCREQYGGGYGEIGLVIAGPRMRSVILGSITLSQLGFVCAGIVFTAENLASFASAVAQTNASLNGSVLSTNAIIALEVAVLVPLGFVRDIARLGPAALLGDVFIAIGFVYMYAYDVGAIASRGWHVHETVQVWFNPSGYALTIGTAIFTFEGIGLILPIQSSMARPERFRGLLSIVMTIITIAYISIGALGYAAFGADTKTEIIDNYPRDSGLVQTVQCLYAVAVLAGIPVQLFPAVRIVEGWLFQRRAGTSSSTATVAAAASGNGAAAPVYYHYSGKRDPRIKWAKNALRTALVVACSVVAALGAGHLDRFVALIGSLACVPLLFIYPPLLHYIGLGDRSSALVKALDIGLIITGIVAMIFTTIVTIKGGL